MECNKDEAIRAREVAENKFMAKDIVGAKKFALKAQNLFPGLEGIAQMIITLDIYLASEIKIYGEKDWYAILGLDSSADDEVLKKQYRKLALMLHPDKNKSFGAEGAFKLISEAWGVLSDKSKKMVYDQKRTVKGLQQKSFLSKDSAPSAEKVFRSVNISTPKSHPQKSVNKSSTSAALKNCQSLKSGSFWTSCDRCKMQYEYLRMYLNRNLLCPHCHEAFIAKELKTPVVGQKFSGPCSSNKQNQSSSNISSGKNDFATGSVNPTMYGKGLSGNDIGSQQFHNGPSETSRAAKKPVFSTSVLTANANLHANQKVRKEQEEAQLAARREREEALWKKNMNLKKNVDGNVNAVPTDSFALKRKRRVDNDVGNEKGGGSKQKSAAFKTQRANGDSVNLNASRPSGRQNNLPRNVTPIGMRNLLVDLTKSLIVKKLEVWNAASEEKAKGKENAKKQNLDDSNKEKMKDDMSSEKNIQKMLNEQKNSTKENGPGKNSYNDPSYNVEQSVSIDVPDSDFYNFDEDRMEHAFGSDQVWATYDEEDGMPRYYALFQKIISLKPFKVRISFLTSKSNNEFSSLNWVASGFTKTCGDFRISKYEVVDSINIFSHKVRWEKGPRGIIKIYPRKTEIWALYRNWSPKWNEQTSDEIMYKYDMAEVMDDYSEEKGIVVASLIKVPGFKAIFCRHKDPKEIKTISKEEMFRFSHQVPYRLLTGGEAHNSPKGCYELDPAATPLELLQVIKESQSHDITETTEVPVNQE